MGRDWHALALLATAALFGCGGGADDETKIDAAAAVPAGRSLAIARRTVATKTMRADSLRADSLGGLDDSVRQGREMDVLRETFAYQGGARDPFNSLIADASTGPELVDLELVGIYMNMETPSNSVVVLREKKEGKKRYKMRAGDRLGRIRLARIDDRNAVFMIQDLGYERQETLSLRKQEDATP